jgi:gas vesicle protein
MAGAQVRIRTVVTTMFGAGIGAGAMYLLDPDSGEQRRRALRRDAYQQVKLGAATATKAGLELSRDVTTAAVDGFQEARAEADD